MIKTVEQEYHVSVAPSKASWVYKLSISVVRAISVVMFRSPALVGKKNIPAYGPFIIASNHGCMFDPYDISWFFSFRTPIRWFARMESAMASRVASDIRKHARLWYPLALLAGALGAWIRRRQHVILVDRTNPKSRMNADAFNTARTVLRRGGIVGVFPEGGILKETRRDDAASSVALLAKLSGAPVLPVYVGHRKVIVGEKFCFDPASDKLSEFAEATMARIYALSENYDREILDIARKVWPAGY